MDTSVSDSERADGLAASPSPSALGRPASGKKPSHGHGHGHGHGLGVGVGAGGGRGFHGGGGVNLEDDSVTSSVTMDIAGGTGTGPYEAALLSPAYHKYEQAGAARASAAAVAEAPDSSLGRSSAHRAAATSAVPVAAKNAAAPRGGGLAAAPVQVAIANSDWVEVNDGRKVFWFNKATREAINTRPVDLVSALSPQPVVQPPEPWQALTTEEGHVYYYNAITGVSSWTLEM